MEIKVIQFDGKNPKKVKDAARPEVVDFLMKILTAELTDERVHRIGNSEILFSIHDVEMIDSNGSKVLVDVPFLIKPVAKDFVTWETSKGDKREAVDATKLAEIYEDECKRKAAEKAEKDAKKAEKIAKDAAKRAERAKEKGE